ncbi:MAG: creatininase family protein [Chloroflexota bacterium]|jgi:creatinine amidohydrolase
MENVFVGKMPWRQVEAAIKRGAAALFPMGSTEEHGPHSPMGDYLAAEEISLRVARETGDLVFPPLPFSYSEYFRNFPGTITLSSQCLYQFVLEVVDCLIGSGFKHIVLVNGHKGNSPTLLHLVRDIRREKGLLVPVVSPLAFGLTPAVDKEIYGDYKWAHGGEPMGSLMSYLVPGTVDLSRVEDWGSKDFHGLPAGLDGVVFEGVQVSMPICMEDIAPPSGSLSDPRMASVERGQRMADESVNRLVRFIRWFKGINPIVKGG